MSNKTSKIRRSKKLKMDLKRLGKTRLVVHKSNRYLYAQVINADNVVIASSSSLEKAVKDEYKSFCNVEVAKKVGELVAKRASEKSVTDVAFDRNGLKYHGKISALADAAREFGLKF